MIADEDLVSVVRAFRAGLLDGRTSDGMCGVVCFALQPYLHTIGVTTVLMASTPSIGEWKGHLWFALGDGRALDPTADQYGGGRPAVYLGQPDPEIHCGARWFTLAEAKSMAGELGGKKRRRANR